LSHTTDTEIATMKEIIEGFLKFQKNASPSELSYSKVWPISRVREHYSFPALTAVWYQSWLPSVNPAICL
jgi:hypothetical protein